MKKVIATPNAPAALGPYSQAVLTNDVLYGSGQVGLNPETGDFAGSTIEDQAQQVFKNIAAVLDAAGLTPANVVKTTIFLNDVNDFSTVNGLYETFFKDSETLPARSCVEVAKLPAGALIEVEYVATK
ncbi:RidA family protein [Paucilactobacillus suebicus]|uniref:Endoribonuclease L-PSP n=1 Tax=Paucilactobacillus suebicus DSM 5007 = KCTC 3549 TaxID=1423807 RepID=A0A0R1WDU5_9LACO|nr:RidA family protein [Paucilactobacillus suebicus]KRM12947.1 endoribonuclease L-PSP [Paucilactobacillus suebicus DSM 5007 = KCTC 3549]